MKSITDDGNDKQNQLDDHGNSSANTTDQSLLEMHVHGHRVFVWTFVLIALLVIITIVFLQGVELKTVNTADLSDDRRSNILDQYNSYSGFIASMISIPFQQLPAMLLPVFFLCFTTHAVMAEHKSFVMTWGPVLSVAAASYLLGLGLSSLNVQFDAPKIRFNMAATDLMAKQADTSSFSRMTDITNTAHLAGVPSTDTILRNAIVTSIKVSDSACTDTSSPFRQKPEASIEFGFTLNSWLDSLLPNSIASSKSFKFSMSDDFTSQQIELTQFPASDLRKTASLLTGAFLTVFGQFAGGSGLLTGYENRMASALEATLTSSDPKSLLNNTQNIIRDASSIIDAVDKDYYVNGTNLWHSIAISDISIELSKFQLSPQILFEAVTFELPVATDVMGDWLAEANYWTDGQVNINNHDVCTALGCVIDTPNIAGTNQNQVRLIPLCAGDNEEELGSMLGYNGCLTMSNSSVLVFSLARHFEAEEAVADIDKWSLTLTKAWTRFQATVGRLSWTTDDLTTVYGSTCAEGINCYGLYFALSDGKRHLVLGEEHIPLPQRTWYFDPSLWQILVAANTQLSGTIQGDIVAYNVTAESAARYNTSKIPDDHCMMPAANYVNNVIERHLYSKDSVQPAYLAGMFWLFQNAAVRQVATENALNTTVVQLLFDGNYSWTSIHAAIPLMSACATFAGCGIILVLGLVVACQSRNQQRQVSLGNHIAAHNANAVLADEGQFPPLLVSVRVKQQGKSNSSEASAPIEQFEIIQHTMILRNRLDMCVRKVTIGSGCVIPDKRTPIENVLVVEIKDTP